MKARKVHRSPDAQRRAERAWKTVGLIKLKNATAVATATTRAARGDKVNTPSTRRCPRNLTHWLISKQVAAADGPERDLVTIMSVCHTVVPETLEDGTIAYRAESPDEEALVAGAADLGMAFRGRSTEGVTLDAFDGERTYEVLVTLPFDSHRRRR